MKLGHLEPEVASYIAIAISLHALLRKLGPIKQQPIYVNTSCKNGNLGTFCEFEKQEVKVQEVLLPPCA